MCRKPSLQSLTLALSILAVSCLMPSAANAQVSEWLRDHVDEYPPHTVHTVIEFEYFPNVPGTEYGIPLVRMNFNNNEEDRFRDVGKAYYHLTMGNAFGYGGPMKFILEEYLGFGYSIRPLRWVATSLTWEPIGVYANPERVFVGSGLTAQLAFPFVVLEWNERAKGMATGFATQDDPEKRVRNYKARFNILPALYLSVGRQGIGIPKGEFTSFAFGVGI